MWLWGVSSFHLLVRNCDMLAPAQVRNQRVPITQRSRGRGRLCDRAGLSHHYMASLYP